MRPSPAKSAPRSAGESTPPRVAWRRKADRIIDQIGMQIVSGRFAAGQRLPTEAQLGRQLAVGRASLREALKELVRRGLVESRARSGTTVLGKDRWDLLNADVLRWMAAAPADPEFLIGLVEARTILEPAAARLAAQRATPAQIVAIERSYRAMAAALPDDVESCCLHDLALHEGIIAAAGNVLLNRFAAAIRTALLSLFRISANARESYENSLAEHWAVVNAIRRRAPEEAERAMHRLLAGTTRDLSPAFDSPAPAQKKKARARPVAAAGAARHPTRETAMLAKTTAMKEET